MSELDYDLDTFAPPEQVARRADLATQGTNPDKAAQAFEVAPKVGLPAPIVQYDLDTFKARADQEERNALVDQNPRLAEFVSDPAKAAAIKDDYKPLNDLSMAIDPDGSLAFARDTQAMDTGFTAGIVSQYSHQNYARIATAYQAGANVEPILRGYETEFEKEKRYEGFQKLVNALGGFVGATASSAQVGMGGAGIGALAGAPAGPGGAAIGATVGFGVGFIGDMFATTSGQTYRRLDLVRADDGSALPEGVKQTAALAAGSIGMGLGIAFGGAGGRVIGNLVGDGIITALSRVGVAKAIGEGVGGITSAGITGGAINAGIAFSQELTPILAQKFSGLDFTDPQQYDRMAATVGEAFVHGSFLFAGLHSVPIGVNYLRDRAAITQTDLDAQQRLSILNAVQVSKTFQRAPELVREYIAAHDYPDVSVSAEEVAKNREAFSYIPDLEDQLNRQLSLGGDITIPAADYFTRTPKELVNSLNEKVRGESGLTPEEAKGLGTDFERYNVPKVEPTEETEGGDRPLSKLGFSVAGSEMAEPQQGRVLESANNAIATQRRAMWLDPVITPDATGMTKPSFARMSKAIQDLQADVEKKAFDIAEREIRRRETPLWKNNLLKETEAAREEMQQRPDFKAWHAMVELGKDDPLSIKLDRNEVDALYNRESPGDYAAFQKDGTRASDSLPAKMFGKADWDPETAANAFGFQSGKEMLDALRQHETNIRESEKPPKAYFDGLVKDEAERRMEAKYGNLSENIMREAIEEALSVKQLDVLIQEMKHLGADETVTKAKLVDGVRENLAGWKADAVKSADFERRVGKWGEEAFRAQQKGDVVAAFQAKQRQAVNFIAAREARAFEKERAALDKLVDRYSTNRSIDSVDQGFTDQIHLILANLGEHVPRTEDNLKEALLDKDKKPITLERFIRDTQNKLNIEIYDSDFLHQQKVKSRKELNVEEARQLKDTLTSLDFGGRRLKKVDLRGKEEAYNDILDNELLPTLDAQARDIDPTRRDAIGQLKTGLRAIDSSFLKMEQLFMWLDKNNPLGPMTKVFYRPLKESEHNFTDAYKATADDWNKNVQVDKEWKKSLNTKVKNSLLMDEDEKPATLYRDNMISMALNVGNDWNLRVLTRGRNWHPDDVMQFLHQNMTKKDWDVVQSVWDRFDKLWPDIRDASKRRSGVAVERIPARDVETPHGTYKGGYYPLFEAPDEAVTRRDKAFGVDQARPFVTLKSISSATQARTGAAYKVDLSLDRLPYAIRETLHEIHFGQALMDVAKFANDKFVLDGIDKAFGPEYRKQLKPWLSYIATDGGATDPSAQGWLTAGSRYLRQNMVTQLVGFRASTGAIHGLSAATNSWAEIGREHFSDQRYLSEATKLLTKNPATGERYFREFEAESGELRNRFHTMDRDLGAVILRDLRAPAGLGKILGDQYDRALFQTLATKHIAYLDYLSAMVVYGAKRAESLEKGMSLSDAIWTAGQTVRSAHGSAGMLDLPAIARGAEGWKWFTTFYGYFNHNYNRLRDTGRFMKGADYMDPATYWQIVSRTMGYLIAPAIVHEMFRGSTKQQDESWAWWMAKGIGSQVSSGVPGVRDVAHALLQGKSPDQISPLGEVYKGVTATMQDAHKFVVGDKSHTAGMQPKDWLSRALQTPGWITGHLPGATGSTLGRLGSAVVTKSASGYPQYLWDKHMKTPDSWDADFWRLFWDGNYHHRKH